MRRCLICATIIGLAGALSSGFAFAQGGLAQAIKHRVMGLSAPGGNRIGGRAITAIPFLTKFYEERGYQPAWRDPIVFSQLRGEILQSRYDGLRAKDFHTHALGFGRLDFWPPAISDAERDILKSSALINLLYQLYFGKVSPKSLDPNWNLKRRPLPVENAARTISIALETAAIPSLVAQARGDGPWYAKLRSALKRYMTIAESGGWPASSGM